MTKYPIAYFIFNRPKHVKLTFDVIRKHRPSQLFIIADGPRPSLLEDKKRCTEVRTIIEQVDWPCEVQRNYAETNLGLKQRVSSGLNWVFEQVENAIVLEDDCLAHPDFFTFCNDLLKRYANDERVWVITGNNFQNGRKCGEASYYFSKYNHCWGWATWRRAWKHFRGDLPFWPDWKVSPDWAAKIPDPVERRYWSRIFDQVYAAQIDSWAYPWTASVWYHGGLTATPNVNLVSNIGFGVDSTHTKSSNTSLSEIPAQSLGTLTHPSIIEQNILADRFAFDYAFGGLNQRFPRSILYTAIKGIASIYRRLN